ncbi:MAG TPA: ribulose-phosphate 3-epimerase [Candidatus Dormibacteraeota bacterium]|nr:ribulose-phosphate 3-epimerase [Candidatus Dormibacteraeota bacterium]
MKILASLTAADPLALGEAARRLRQAGVDGFHVDFGDGRFVPWLGGSLELVQALANAERLPIEVHLMMEEPEAWISPLAAAGASRVLVHLEVVRYPWRLRTIAIHHGLNLGFAVNPVTPVAALEPIAGCADFVSLLTSEPDLASEHFLPGSTDRISLARRLLGLSLEVEVDGGLSAGSLHETALAGADVAVVGRELTLAENPAASLRMLSTAAVGGAA